MVPPEIAVYKEDCWLDLYIAKNPICHTIAPYQDERKKYLLNKKERVKALEIDTIVKELGLEKVNFIKMDIEGVEIDAFLGAEQTIKKFTPKLAICTYHRPTDFEEIKKYSFLQSRLKLKK